MAPVGDETKLLQGVGVEVTNSRFGGCDFIAQLSTQIPGRGWQTGRESLMLFG
jgi:hypothetical protein